MSRHLTFLFQGDSITDCGRSRDEGASLGLRLGPGYPGKVASHLAVHHRDIAWDFYNSGVSGFRIVDLYAGWKINTLNLKPDILSILIGINDTWHEFVRQNGVEVPRYERIYRELLEWTRQVLPECRIILMEPFLVPVPGKTDWVPEVKARGEVVARLAKEMNCAFLPLQSLIEEASSNVPMTYWTADGVHPTLAGHQLIAEALTAEVEKLL